MGAFARDKGILDFWCAGTLMAHAASAYGPTARHFDTVEALLASLHQGPADAGAVLVKGSRFMAMERVVQALRATATAEGSH